MKPVAAVAAAVLVVAACASPIPAAPTASATGAPGQAGPSFVWATPTDLVVSGTAATVRFDGWTATCAAVQVDDCEGVAKLFVNNLARSWQGVFKASGGRIVVEARPACPVPLPGWADASSCWQATAPATTGDVCMVIGRRPKADGAVSTFGQVGGDDMTGRAGGPPPGWPTCD